MQTNKITVLIILINVLLLTSIVEKFKLGKRLKIPYLFLWSVKKIVFYVVYDTETDNALCALSVSVKYESATLKFIIL